MLYETTRQDARFAWSSLRRNPSFSLAAITVVALGIGATTAIFSAANSYFFRPLPFADADRLVRLFETNPEFGWTHADAAPANMMDWRDRVEAFDDVAAYTEFTLRGVYMRDGEAELLTGSSVTGNFFSVLGVQPQLGRGFDWEATWEGNDAVVVLSHGLWQSHFGGDPQVVGSILEVNGNSLEVVGVAPEGFRFPSNETQFWYTMGWARDARDQVWFRRAHFVDVVARLAPGVSRSAADAEFQTVVEQLKGEYPETNRVMGGGMMPIRDFLVREIRGPLMILMGAVALLLLLACVNVANLMLLRAEDRTREVALRYALGAERGRVIRLMVTESLMLAGMGGVAGMALGWTGVQLMEGLTPLGIEGATSLALDGRVLVFTVLTATACGVLFGVLPALRATGGAAGGALRDGSRGTSAGRRGLHTTNALVAVEVALALILVVGAGLMIRSFWLLRDVDPGFTTEGALAVQFTVPGVRYAERDDVLAFYDRFTEALEARPGIERAGVVGQLPLAGTSWSSQFQAEGWPAERVGLEILHRRANRAYFDALGIPLLRGRHFEPTDDPDGPLVVVVNETFVREHFPGEDPLGQRIAYDRSPTPESYWYEIVGVVGDQHQVSPAQPARAEVFENIEQDWERTNWVVVKTGSDALEAVPTVRDVLRELDAAIPIASVRSLRDVWSRSMSQEQFILTLLGVFGALALLLAAVGVYTVAAQAARRRSHEIGIRMALGAATGDVMSLVLRRGLGVVVVGLLTGLLISLAMSRALASQLYAVEPTDPPTLAAVVAVLAGVALVACYLPARSATRLDPVESLRAE